MYLEGMAITLVLNLDVQVEVLFELNLVISPRKEDGGQR
jgi:hypothetical protein